MIADVAAHYEDPLGQIVAEAFQLPHLKTRVLIDYVMGHLPGQLPAWAAADFRHGVGVRISRELRRTWMWEDRHGNRQRQRIYVALNGYHKPFRHISLTEYRSYIDGLEQSSRYDRARISFHKRQYLEAERLATNSEVNTNAEIGDLLGWTDEERAA